ncbi:hypothetical protein [uncultured Helicobacter sp.]|uniref:hypothetical protein n=1 Tax=uncultured Helicobacter sp. TaxID=175537 RepID=UPI00374EE5E0
MSEKVKISNAKQNIYILQYFVKNLNTTTSLTLIQKLKIYFYKHFFLIFCFFIGFLWLLYSLIQVIYITHFSIKSILSLCIALPCYLVCVLYCIEIYEYYVTKDYQKLNIKKEDIEWEQSYIYIKSQFFRSMIKAIFAICFLIPSFNGAFYGGCVFAIMLCITQIPPSTSVYKIFLIKDFIYKGKLHKGGILLYHPNLDCGFYPYGEFLIFQQRLVGHWNWFSLFTIFTIDCIKSIPVQDDTIYGNMNVELPFEGNFNNKLQTLWVKHTKNVLLESSEDIFLKFKTMFEFLVKSPDGFLLCSYKEFAAYQPYLDIVAIQTQRQKGMNNA